ncbi:protein methyltransferase [Bermanella sp. 47_1433_sub80_T6]|nr:protein methyltransferase [Bermanella sp. 47_1433_sub80_T6]
MLNDAFVSVQIMPQCPQIPLYLVDPSTMDRPFSLDEVRRIWDHTAYWAFCWASGQVLARFILDNPHWVKGKKVLDFGAGSGVVAIAAMKAGAREVIACDIDPDALISCRENAKLNKVTLTLSDDLFAIEDNDIDLLIAADVLYDRANLSFLDTFFEYAPKVLLADSRIKNFQHDKYQPLDKVESFTVPDLDEFDEFRLVSLYEGIQA